MTTTTHRKQSPYLKYFVLCLKRNLQNLILWCLKCHLKRLEGLQEDFLPFAQMLEKCERKKTIFPNVLDGRSSAHQSYCTWIKLNTVLKWNKEVILHQSPCPCWLDQCPRGPVEMRRIRSIHSRLPAMNVLKFAWSTRTPLIKTPHTFYTSRGSTAQVWAHQSSWRDLGRDLTENSVMMLMSQFPQKADSIWLMAKNQNCVWTK